MGHLRHGADDRALRHVPRQDDPHRVVAADAVGRHSASRRRGRLRGQRRSCHPAARLPPDPARAAWRRGNAVRGGRLRPGGGRRGRGRGRRGSLRRGGERRVMPSLDGASPYQAAPYKAAEYQRLLAAARRSLELTGGALAGSISVSRPTDAERKAIIGITGPYRDTRTARITVRLADLDNAVREATGRGLPELLAELGGPLRNRPAERSALAAAREWAIRAAETSSLHVSCGWYRDWLAEIAVDGS